MKYILPIFFRYASLILQFLVVALITRRLGREEAGVYFEVFGVINATYFLFGLGLPDGLVRHVAHADATARSSEIRSMIARATLATGASAALLVAVGVVAGLRFEGALVTRTIIVATAIWWVCYGATFFASQILVATNRSSLGAFFFYPAMNIALFATSVPYLVFAARPTLELTLSAAVGGGVLCAGAASAYAVAATLSYPPTETRAPIAPAFRLGLSIGIARVLQSCLYWIPVWAVGLWLGPEPAALFGTASRLNVAIAAMMAAIRFTIRPTIVRLAAQGDWPGIAREGRRAANLATAGAALAGLCALAIGAPAIGFAFGEAYRDASWLLFILIFGTLGECLGGAVDEILKMTGRANVVTIILAATFLSLSVSVALLRHSEIYTFAIAQSVNIFVMYASFLIFVKNNNNVWVGFSIK